MMYLATKLFVVALALLAAAYLIPGIVVTDFSTALIVALLLGALNIFVRPLIVLITLPLSLLTLGFFIFVINACLFWFVASFVDGFDVTGFIPAFLGALFVSVVSTLANKFLS